MLDDRLEVGTTVSVEPAEWMPKKPRKTIDELLAEFGSKPVTPDDPTFDMDPFGSDEEVEAFIEWVYEMRRSDHV